jgi:hypothetical protein
MPSKTARAQGLGVRFWCRPHTHTYTQGMLNNILCRKTTRPRPIPDPHFLTALHCVDGLITVSGCCVCSRDFLYNEESFSFRFKGFLRFDDTETGINPLFACAGCKDALPGVGRLSASEVWTHVDKNTDLTDTDLDTRYGIKNLYDLRVEICTTRPGSYASDDGLYSEQLLLIK